MTETTRRPFGVSFLSLLMIVLGLLQVGTGIMLLTHRNDDGVLDALDTTSDSVTGIAIAVIVFGALGVLVASALRSGRNWARILVGLLAAANVVTLIAAAISSHQVHWYNVAWPAVIYSLVAGYLFLDEDAQRYFA